MAGENAKPLTSTKFDLLSVIAIIGAIGVFAFGLLWHHGHPRILWDLAAIVVATFGSFFGIMLTCSNSDLKSLPAILRKVFVYEDYDLDVLMDRFAEYAQIARKDGILSLEKEATSVEDPFLRKGLQLAVDGTSPDLIEDVMSAQMKAMMERHEIAKKIIDTWATFAPAFGMMGTIMALCIVLMKLDDPKAIAPGMALALLSTFYGVLLCYGVLTPMSKKLERRSREEVLVRKLTIRAIIGLQEGESPNILKRKLIGIVKRSAQLKAESM